MGHIRIRDGTWKKKLLPFLLAQQFKTHTSPDLSLTVFTSLKAWKTLIAMEHSETTTTTTPIPLEACLLSIPKYQLKGMAT